MKNDGLAPPHRAPLLWLCLPFAAGIATADALLRTMPGSLWAGVALVSATGLLWARHAKLEIGMRLGLLLTMCATGALHYTVTRDRLPEWDQLPDREIIFSIRVERVWSSSADGRLYNFLGRLTDVNHPAAELNNQWTHVQLRRPQDPAAGLERGATLRLIGRVVPLREDNAYRFDQYLEEQGLNFRVRQARWLGNLAPPSAYAQAREALKHHAGSTLSAGLEQHPDLAGALRAMLLGERHELSDNAKTLFMRSGTMHLFAISGLHIGVIAVTVLVTLRLLRLPRGLRFLAGAILLWLYVDLIGRPPSAQRAWLMITCYHAARTLRAPGNPLSAIAASALLVLLIDPRQLFSAGFQMSYAIVFALLIHGVPLGEQWQRRVRPWRDLPTASLAWWQRSTQAGVKGLMMAAALTWTASLIGLLTSIAFFGWFTPLAFYANVLLVPLAGGVVAAGFAAIVLGWLGLANVALLFNHAAAVVLVIMRTGLELGLGNTGSVPAEFAVPLWGQACMLTVLMSMAFVRERVPPDSRWFGGIPALVALLGLVIGLLLP